MAAKREADELVGQAKTTRDQADSYAASKREEADDQAAAILHKAGEEADAQIEERRAAAQSELDGLSKRIAELQNASPSSPSVFRNCVLCSRRRSPDSLSAVMRRPLVRIRKPLPWRHCRWLRPSRKSSLYTTRPMTSRVSWAETSRLPTITMRQMRHRLIRLIRLRRMSSPNRLSRPSTRHRANRRPRLGESGRI